MAVTATQRWKLAFPFSRETTPEVLSSSTAWSATTAAAVPDSLLGPSGTPILTAGYEGYTKASWSELMRSSPATASYIERWAWWMLGVGSLPKVGNEGRNLFNS